MIGLDMADFFEELAKKTWGVLSTGRRFATKKQMKYIFMDIQSKVQFQNRDMILDIGGGTGQLARFIAPEVASIHLVDRLPNIVSKTIKMNNLFVYVRDVSKPFFLGDMMFDKIICYNTIHNIDVDFAIFIKRLLPITKTKGIIFIGDIPLTEKYEQAKEKYTTFGTLRYVIQKLVTNMFYRLLGIRSRPFFRSFTREEIVQALVNIPNV